MLLNRCRSAIYDFGFRVACPAPSRDSSRFKILSCNPNAGCLRAGWTGRRGFESLNDAGDGEMPASKLPLGSWEWASALNYLPSSLRAVGRKSRK
jgi:hypothetical protein